MGALNLQKNMLDPIEKIELVLLDAMGVIYAAGDDVGELLIPFLREHGSQADEVLIQDAYRQTSLGHMSAPAFWTAMGVAPELEDQYLTRHRLQTGLMAFIHRLPPRLRLACLSNDVAQWSKKLRHQFALDACIPHWIISGDVGFRKPEPRIYDIATMQLELAPERILFVDDRLANVHAARNQGMHAVLFESAQTASSEETFTFNALLNLLDA